MIPSAINPSTVTVRGHVLLSWVILMPAPIRPLALRPATATVRRCALPFLVSAIPILIGPLVFRDQVQVATVSRDRNPAGEGDGGQSLRRCRKMFGSASHQTRSIRQSVLRVCGVVDVVGSAASYPFLAGLCVLCTASFSRMDS